MNHHIKRFLFKYYALISATSFVGAVLLFVFRFLMWEALAAVVAGVVSFALSVQKQQLEEVRLFRSLFEEFNKRYNAQNEELNRIHQQPPEAPLSESERDALFDYFNLCGEEHLYFAQGFIYPEVWRSWKNGMEFFRQNPRISKLWDLELKTDSYYGLHFNREDNADSVVRETAPNLRIVMPVAGTK